MTLIKPISYWKQKVKSSVIIPTDIPQSANVLFRYELPLTNANLTTKVWTDTSGLGYTTGLIEGSVPTTIDSSNALYFNNSQVTRNGRLRITTNTNVTIKTLCILYNNPFAQYGGTSTNRNYFWDMRSAGTTSSGGYLNQYDSIDGTNTAIYWNGAYWAWDDTLKVTSWTNLPTTPVYLTNGGNNLYGGTNAYQWLGPNGRAINNSHRLWMFNFNNASKPFNFTSTATKGLIFGTNDNYSEGSSFGIFSIIGWSTLLNTTDWEQLKLYYKGTGALTL